MLIKTQRTVNE